MMLEIDGLTNTLRTLFRHCLKPTHDRHPIHYLPIIARNRAFSRPVLSRRGRRKKLKIRKTRGQKLSTILLRKLTNLLRRFSILLPDKKLQISHDVRHVRITDIECTVRHRNNYSEVNHIIFCLLKTLLHETREHFLTVVGRC